MAGRRNDGGSRVSIALLGRRRRLGLAGAALPGQEGNGIRLKKGSYNQHVVGGDVWQGMGVGGAWCPPRWTLLGGGDTGNSNNVVALAATRAGVRQRGVVEVALVGRW